MAGLPTPVNPIPLLGPAPHGIFDDEAQAPQIPADGLVRASRRGQWLNREDLQAMPGLLVVHEHGHDGRSAAAGEHYRTGGRPGGVAEEVDGDTTGPICMNTMVPALKALRACCARPWR